MKKWTTVDVLFPVVFSSFAVGIITGVTAYFGLYHIYYYSGTTVNYAVIVPLSMVVAILAGLLALTSFILVVIFPTMKQKESKVPEPEPDATEAYEGTKCTTEHLVETLVRKT